MKKYLFNLMVATMVAMTSVSFISCGEDDENFSSEKPSALLKDANGKKIFLPASGYYNKKSMEGFGTGCYYWSSTEVIDAKACTIKAFANDHQAYSTTMLRWLGLPVRPVQ